MQEKFKTEEEKMRQQTCGSIERFWEYLRGSFAKRESFTLNVKKEGEKDV